MSGVCSFYWLGWFGFVFLVFVCVIIFLLALQSSPANALHTQHTHQGREHVLRRVRGALPGQAAALAGGGELGPVGLELGGGVELDEAQVLAGGPQLGGNGVV